MKSEVRGQRSEVRGQKSEVLSLEPRTTKLVALALLLALGIVLYIIESLYLPPLPIPGAKLGLTSIVTLLMLASFSWQECLLNVVLRTVVGSLIGGTFLAPPFFFSLTGALASAIVMILVYNNFYGKFSLVGISLTGATTHNFAQLVFARFFIGQAAVFFYLPFLVFLATITGLLNGMAANFVTERIKVQARLLKNCSGGL